MEPFYPSWDKALIGSNVQELFGFSMPDEEESSFYQTVDGQKKIILHYAAPPSGWRYLGVVDYARVIAASDSIIVITIAVLILRYACARCLHLWYQKHYKTDQKADSYYGRGRG